jgi:hypothetical protein
VRGLIDAGDQPVSSSDYFVPSAAKISCVRGGARVPLGTLAPFSVRTMRQLPSLLQASVK